MNKSLGPKKILVVTLSNLGDAVLTTPVIAALREHFPVAELSILAGERSAGLFQGHVWVRHVYVYDKKASLRKKWDLILQMRREQFDLAVDFRHSLFPILIGAKNWNPLFQWGETKVGKHAVDDHLATLKALNVPSDFHAFFPFFNEKELKDTSELFRTQAVRLDAPFVVMAPGARSHLKRWDSNRFAQLAKTLHRQFKWPIVLVGDQSEKSICDQVAESVGDGVVNFAGLTTVQESAVVLAHARLVVTNDSACLHLADQQKSPTVAIFGPTDETRYGPRNGSSRVVRRTLFCSPCGLAQCPYRHECMENLSFEEVLRACLDTLQAERTVTV